MTQNGKNLPAKQETRVQYLGWEDLLEEEMPTHSSILAWRVPGTEEPAGLQSVGSQTDTLILPLSNIKVTNSLENYLT